MSQMFNDKAIISLKSQQLSAIHRTYYPHLCKLSAIFSFSANFPQHSFQVLSKHNIRNFCRRLHFTSSDFLSLSITRNPGTVALKLFVRSAVIKSPQFQNGFFVLSSQKSKSPRVCPLFVWKIFNGI